MIACTHPRTSCAISASIFVRLLCTNSSLDPTPASCTHAHAHSLLQLRTFSSCPFLSCFAFYCLRKIIRSPRPRHSEALSHSFYCLRARSNDGDNMCHRPHITYAPYHHHILPLCSAHFPSLSLMAMVHPHIYLQSSQGCGHLSPRREDESLHVSSIHPFISLVLHSGTDNLSTHKHDAKRTV